MFAALKRLWTPGDVQMAAHRAYVQLVEMARNPDFYTHMGVPDTLDGRFDMIVLHVCLELSRLERNAHGADMARALQEVFFADMDRSVREMGVSDTGVGVRVKKMAQAFYGRKKAYAEAADVGSLETALRRNVWRDEPVDEKNLHALAQYVAAQRNRT